MARSEFRRHLQPRDQRQSGRQHAYADNKQGGCRIGQCAVAFRRDEFPIFGLAENPTCGNRLNLGKDQLSFSADDPRHRVGRQPGHGEGVDQSSLQKQPKQDKYQRRNQDCQEGKQTVISSCRMKLVSSSAYCRGRAPVPDAARQGADEKEQESCGGQ